MTTKDNPVKIVPKRYVQVQGDSKTVAYEDPIILDIIRSKEVTTNVMVGDVINLEEELFSSTFVGATQVQSTEVEMISEKHNEDNQSNKFPDMRIIGTWSDAVNDLGYIQDPPILEWFEFF